MELINLAFFFNLKASNEKNELWMVSRWYFIHLLFEIIFFPSRRPIFLFLSEVIGAFISVLMIWIVTGVLVYLAIQRLVNKEFDIDAKIMLITSGLGVLINLVMGCTLHQHGHSHGGGSHMHSHSAHSHDSENQPLLSHSHNGHTHDDVENINVRAAFIHVVGDFVQSLGVFIAALVIFFKVSLLTNSQVLLI